MEPIYIFSSYPGDTILPTSMSAQEEEQAMSVRSDGPITRARARAIASATSSFLRRASLDVTEVSEAPTTVTFTALLETGHPDIGCPFPALRTITL